MMLLLMVVDRWTCHMGLQQQHQWQLLDKHRELLLLLLLFDMDLVVVVEQ